MAGTKDDRAEGWYQTAAMHFHHYAAKIRAKIQKEESSSWTVFSREESQGKSEAPASSKKGNKGLQRRAGRPEHEHVRIVCLCAEEDESRRNDADTRDAARTAERVGDPTEHDPVGVGLLRPRRWISRRRMADCHPEAPAPNQTDHCADSRSESEAATASSDHRCGSAARSNQVDLTGHERLECRCRTLAVHRGPTLSQGICCSTNARTSSAVPSDRILHSFAKVLA